MKKNSRLVYSTDSGRVAPEKTSQNAVSTYSDGIIRVSRETKGRNGKGVTVVVGFDMTPEELKKFGKKLKQVCGTGGTAKEGRIEIQGDQREKIVEFLTQEGFTAKISGG
ncbi:MAG: stress response translation initiation inhibitor YciH [Agarilytica sp.]